VAEPEPSNVSELPTPLPTEVVIDPNHPIPPHNARDVGILKGLTGKTFTELMGSEGDDETRMAVTIWLHLRRMGFDPTLDEAAEVLIRYEEPTPDPTSDRPSTTSPPSATSGAAPPETLTR
jgi:hypothetical protein